MVLVSFKFPINSVAKVRSCKTDILHGIACTAIIFFVNFLDQCETDRKTNGTLLKTGGETLKERKPLSKIDRHSCRRLRRFLILESCNAYISSICSIYVYMNTYLRAIAAILLVGRVERASTAARF